MNTKNKKIKLLEEKYMLIGQNMEDYLDGLLYANPLHYWNYTHVDTLLSLQHPKTDFPDEVVFIIYHQITELYFKLVLHEMEQIANNGKKISPSGQDMGWNKKIDVNFFIERINRINRYFDALIQSFDIMVDGMEKKQFLKFRMSLLPGSGFQSLQYRLIEIASTDLINLSKNKRKKASLGSLVNSFYWKHGARDLSTGKSTLMLENFFGRYKSSFLKQAKEYETKNIYKKYLSLNKRDKENASLIEQLKQLDLNVNVNWPLVHYKSAVKYLQKSPKEINATGGTNWKKYLPPRFQKVIFFPEIWNKKEIKDWGKSGIVNLLKDS